MNKPKLIRIDPDVLESVTKLAKENDRSIPRQINRMLREIKPVMFHPDCRNCAKVYGQKKMKAVKCKRD